MGKLSWIIWMGPKYNHNCLYKREAKKKKAMCGLKLDPTLKALEMEEAATSQVMQRMQL